MNTLKLPKMFVSYREGWQELIEDHPSVSRLFAMYVVPMSLIPTVMIVYAMMVTPGEIFPALVPEISGFEATAIAIAFFLAQLGMVVLMASIIQQMGDVVDVKPAYADAFMLAAVAPTPLWLSALVLFIPSVWVNGFVVAVAWVGSAALIYHGVAPLFRLENRSKARLMGTFILLAGIIAWAALLVVLTLVLSMIVGFR